MRLVLFISTNGDYECGCYHEVLPIEYESPEAAYSDLIDAFKEKMAELEKFNEACRLHFKDKPPRPTLYNGKNTKVLEKHKKTEQEYYDAYLAWNANQPKLTTGHDVVFCGHEFYVTSYDLDSIEVKTLDQWFHDDCENFSGK